MNKIKQAKECVSRGWWSLLEEYMPRIEKLVPGADFLVKEKFGTLRIRVCNCFLTEEIANRVLELESAAERESATICECCGGSGQLRYDRVWIATLCDECNKNKE